MAKKSNKKPGEVVKKNSALVMKKRDNNILHSRFTKVILIIMILAFVGIPVAQLIMLLFD